jgi:hypothetical protein
VLAEDNVLVRPTLVTPLEQPRATWLQALWAREWLVVVLLLAWSAFLFFWRLPDPPQYIYDEVYHAYTGLHMAWNDPAIYEWWKSAPTVGVPEGVQNEWTHPPLGKLIIGGGIWLFGNNSFGWRSTNALFGIICVGLLYLLARTLFRDRLLATLAAGIITVEGLMFAESRIGTNDIFQLAFLLAAYTCFAKFYWRPARSGIGWLFATGLFLGLAFGTKWPAFFSILLLGGLAFLRAVWPEPWTARLQTIRPRPAVLRTPGSEEPATPNLERDAYAALDREPAPARGVDSSSADAVLDVVATPGAEPGLRVGRDVEPSLTARHNADPSLVAQQPGEPDVLVPRGTDASTLVTQDAEAEPLLSHGAGARPLTTRDTDAESGTVLSQNAEPSSLNSESQARAARWPFFARLGYLIAALVAMVLLPVGLYVASYLQMFLQPHDIPAAYAEVGPIKLGPISLGPATLPDSSWRSMFVGEQWQMWHYHTTLTAGHPYYSKPWQWLLDIRPVFYYVNRGDDTVANTYNLGNPLLYWAFPIVIVLSGYLIWKKRDLALALVMGAFLINWAPWFASPRGMFFYHFLPSVPFLVLMAAYCLAWLWRQPNRKWRRVAGIYVAVVFVSFAFFYTQLAAWTVPTWYADIHYWLPSWQ